MIAHFNIKAVWSMTTVPPMYPSPIESVQIFLYEMKGWICKLERTLTKFEIEKVGGGTTSSIKQPITDKKGRSTQQSK